MEQELILNNENITLQDLYNVAVNNYKVTLGNEAIKKINDSRMIVDELIKNTNITYGITTGFGSLKDKVISVEDLERLQHNLIESHAIGTGDPAPPYIVRSMFLLRLCCIIKGNSGVRLSIA